MSRFMGWTLSYPEISPARSRFTYSLGGSLRHVADLPASSATHFVASGTLLLKSEEAIFSQTRFRERRCEKHLAIFNRPYRHVRQQRLTSLHGLPRTARCYVAGLLVHTCRFYLRQF